MSFDYFHCIDYDIILCWYSLQCLSSEGQHNCGQFLRPDNVRKISCKEFSNPTSEFKILLYIICWHKHGGM